MGEALRQTEMAQETATADALMSALADFVNAEMPALNGYNFQALPPDISLQNAPTYAVELHDAQGLVVTYKFNYFRSAIDGADFWRLFPVVIQWQGNPPRRTAGMDATIIEHCLTALRRFFSKDLQSGAMHMVMASGYLTTQRQGRAFFENLGWNMHYFEKDNGDYPALAHAPESLRSIARRIDDISMPFRTEEAESRMLCFALTSV